jgi:hypothetical protein
MPSRLLARSPTYRYNPKPQDDLESFVKMFYFTMFPSTPEFGSQEEISKFWEAVQKLAYWQELFGMAENLDYKGIKKKVCEIML